MAKHRIPHTITYPDTAPCGKLYLVRRDFGKERWYDDTAQLRGHTAAQATRQAWLESDWLPNTIPWRKILLLSTMRETLTGFEFRIADSLIFAAASRRRRVGWIAVRENEAGELPKYAIGVALAAQEFPAHRVANAVTKAFHPEDVRAHISDVDVATTEQGKGVGVALFDAVLASLPPDMVPTTCIPGENPELEAGLAALGFKKTGDHIRTDLFGEWVPLPATHFQADSDGAVRKRLHENFPWLAGADIGY